MSATQVVKFLIEADADIVARNCYLWTPLDCAAAYGWVKCAKLLLEVRRHDSNIASHIYAYTDPST